MDNGKCQKKGVVYVARGVCVCVCHHTKIAKTFTTGNGLKGCAAMPVFLGSLSAVVERGKKPPQLSKPSNATHPLDHIQAVLRGVPFTGLHFKVGLQNILPYRGHLNT